MCRTVNKYKEPYDIYIGRPSRWGNPFPVADKTEGSRQEAIARYREHLWKQIKSGEVSLTDLIELDGKRLGCFCKPKACHGDILVKAVHWAKAQ